MVKRITYIVFILFLSVSFPILGQTVEQLKKERKQIERQLEQTGKRIQETQKSEKVSLKKINVIKQGVLERKALINNYSTEINLLDKKIDRLTREKASLEKELDKLKRNYVRLIQKAQVNQNVYSRLMFVFSADNFDQSMRRMRYLHEFTDYERLQGEKIKEIQKLLTQKTDSLGTHKSSKVEAVQAKKAETVKLQKDEKKEKIVLSSLQKKEQNLTSEYQKHQQKVNEINAKIDQIIAEQVRKAEERRKAEEAKKKSLAEQKSKDTGTTNTTKTETTSKDATTLSMDEISKETREENLLSGNFERNKGRLPWPVERGSVSGHFGVQPHPVLTKVTVNNKGTYFQSPAGTNARAVYDGVVTAVFSVQGSQNVIVQHGNFRTVYGNLSNVYVKMNQKVTAKQAVGKIYSDDDTGKTELYFQIWQGKQLLNPEGWIAR